MQGGPSALDLGQPLPIDSTYYEMSDCYIAKFFGDLYTNTAQPLLDNILPNVNPHHCASSVHVFICTKRWTVS